MKGMNEKGFVVVNWILGALILLVIAFGFYYLYLNIPGEAENLDLVIVGGQFEDVAASVENQTDFLLVSQFYPNMKFNHNAISYEIGLDCSGEKRGRMIEAFNNLASKVELISFYEVMSNPDIEISCSEQEKNGVDEEYFIAGEGGAKEIVQTGRYNVISDGMVILHGNPHRALECDWANIELHELIHVFGFQHSEDPNSLMYPYLEDCDQKLDDSIIDELKRLYSEINLADLYFEKVSAVKKGRYLDFNLTIKNSGSINSEATQFSILDDGNLVESFDLGEINYGAGLSVEIKNLKLGSRNPDEIRFVIDREDIVDEYDSENNVATVKLS